MKKLNKKIKSIFTASHIMIGTFGLFAHSLTYAYEKAVINNQQTLETVVTSSHRVGAVNQTGISEVVTIRRRSNTNGSYSYFVAGVRPDGKIEWQSQLYSNQGLPLLGPTPLSPAIVGARPIDASSVFVGHPTINVIIKNPLNPSNGRYIYRLMTQNGVFVGRLHALPNTPMDHADISTLGGNGSAERLLLVSSRLENQSTGAYVNRMHTAIWNGPDAFATTAQGNRGWSGNVDQKYNQVVPASDTHFVSWVPGFSSNFNSQGTHGGFQETFHIASLKPNTIKVSRFGFNTSNGNITGPLVSNSRTTADLGVGHLFGTFKDQLIYSGVITPTIGALSLLWQQSSGQLLIRKLCQLHLPFNNNSSYSGGSLAYEVLTLPPLRCAIPTGTDISNPNGVAVRLSTQAQMISGDSGYVLFHTHTSDPQNPQVAYGYQVISRVSPINGNIEVLLAQRSVSPSSAIGFGVIMDFIIKGGTHLSTVGLFWDRYFGLQQSSVGNHEGFLRQQPLP